MGKGPDVEEGRTPGPFSGQALKGFISEKPELNGLRRPEITLALEGLSNTLQRASLGGRDIMCLGDTTTTTTITVITTTTITIITILQQSNPGFYYLTKNQQQPAVFGNTHK